MSSAERLQQALGAEITIERELGGGGMSRVYLALDRALNRRIVVKVLPSDVGTGVSADRFRREIALAAALQHPHIVPVLQAGEVDGVPYYTMPFVAGESLRARLAQGPLSIADVVAHVRDVARALSYAHEHGVVHRDIKPDNILISGGSATVADFGIAKAISAARGGDQPGATLTQVGTSIGTPTYMAPEQAAADPNTDHRADLYALGCVVYELLSGQPPFVAPTPQKLLAAHMAEAPRRIAELRPDTPAALADVVMRCLAKDADARPRSAAEIVRALETVTTGSGSAEAMPPILLGGRRAVLRALAIWAAAFIATAILAKAAIVGIGLPSWVFPGAMAVAGLGLPVILFTAWVQHTTRKLMTATPSFTPGGTPSAVQGTMATIAIKASPHMSWKRNARLGLSAGALFLLVVGGYMAMRTFGIGPAASLLSSGEIAENERVLVADIASPSSDSSLGPVVTEAVRTALGESQSIMVLQQAAISEVLQRMQRPETTPVTFAVAREIATREGVKVVVDGKLLALGGKYVLTLRLVSARTGEELASFRETADSESDILPVIDRITRDVRAKLGDSLKRIQSAPPFEQVTTPSLDALKKYVEGTRKFNVESDFDGGMALLQQAVTIDTGFAMAYRKMAMEYNNKGYTERGEAMNERAFAYRGRLSDAERLLVEGGYFRTGRKADSAATRQAYEQLLELQPKNTTAMNNLALQFLAQRQFDKAEVLLRKAIATGPLASVYFVNLLRAVADAKGLDEMGRVMADFRTAMPTNPAVDYYASQVAWAAGRFDSADVYMSESKARSAGRTNRLVNLILVAVHLQAQGRLREGRRIAAEVFGELEQGGRAGSVLASVATDAYLRAFVLGDKAQAIQQLDAAVKQYPPESLPPIQAEAVQVAALAYAAAGRPDRARAMLAVWDKLHADFRQPNVGTRQAMVAEIAIAEKRYADAVAAWRKGDVGTCVHCAPVGLGIAHDLMGQADSAIANFERYITLPVIDRGPVDQFYLAGAHKRLGELYEAKGEKSKALSHYLTFVELWKNADPELQPRVAEVRAAIKRVRDTEGSR